MGNLSPKKGSFIIRISKSSEKIWNIELSRKNVSKGVKFSIKYKVMKKLFDVRNFTLFNPKKMRIFVEILSDCVSLRLSDLVK